MRIATAILFALPLFFLPPYYMASRFEHSFIPSLCFYLLSLLTFAFPLLRGKKWVKVSYYSMGLFSFLFVLFVMRDLLQLIPGLVIPVLAPVLAGIFLTLLGFWWGRKPKLKKIEIEIPGLPEKLKGLTLIQISDLHVGTNINRHYVDRITKQCEELNPDLIVLTGDIGDSEVDLHKEELNSFKTLRPKLGMFFVPGNHEYYWDVNAWIEVMKNIGATPLLNQGQTIHHNDETIFMAGITDTMDRRNPPDLIKAKQGGEDAKLKILLAHRPDPAKVASKLGFHFQLSGHTHGGQFFPWTIAVRLVHRHHLGLFTEGKMKIYVSGGTGSWGPLLRLGSTAELTYITLV